jgi:hypothetical protein
LDSLSLSLVLINLILSNFSLESKRTITSIELLSLDKNTLYSPDSIPSNSDLLEVSSFICDDGGVGGIILSIEGASYITGFCFIFGGDGISNEPS